MQARSLAIALLLVPVSCGSEGERGTPAASAAPGSASASSGAASTATSAPAAAATSEGKTVDAGGILFVEPEGWKRETPTSAMRKLQYTLPRAGGDAEDASLVVFYFGPGQGGGIQANLDRWASQFEQPGGGASTDAMQVTTRKAGEFAVTDAALSGVYVAETTPGSGVRLRKEGWRMLASILESGQNAWYVKLVGPAATIAHWEPSYRRFTSEVRTTR